MCAYFLCRTGKIKYSTASIATFTRCSSKIVCYLCTLYYIGGGEEKEEKRRRRWWSFHLHCCWIFTDAFLSSFLAPSCWLIILIQTNGGAVLEYYNYYICGRWGRGGGEEVTGPDNCFKALMSHPTKLWVGRVGGFFEVDLARTLINCLAIDKLHVACPDD